MESQLIHRRPRQERRRGFLVFTFVLLVVSVFPLSGAFAVDWSPLVNRLVADGQAQERMSLLFARPDVLFEPQPMSVKLQELIKKRFQKPPSSGRTGTLYAGYLRPEVIAGARFFLEQNRESLEAITASYCVPKEIVVSIMLVETRLGSFLGSKSAFNTLASMALCRDLDIIRPYLPKKLLMPDQREFLQTRCKQKSDWAYNELKFLIEYADRIGADPVSIPGSSFGAIGFCQFMPSNAFLFGIDADKDGRIDLFATHDALHSIANYLGKHGWRCRMSKDKQHRVIMSYNKSHAYANTVLAIAEKLKVKPKLVKGKGTMS